MSSGVRWLTLSQLRAQPADAPIEAQVVAVMPYLREDAARQAAELMLSRAGAPLLVLAVFDDERAGPMVIWNCAISRIRSPYFIYCAEDAFAGRYWLRYALQAMQQPGAGLLAFNDGKWFGQLAAFGLVRRTWLAPIYGGALFHPDYAQHYGDTELTLIARQQQALVYHPHALLIEVDYMKDRRPVNAADHHLFQKRSEHGFDNLVHDAKLRKCVA